MANIHPELNAQALLFTPPAERRGRSHSFHDHDSPNTSSSEERKEKDNGKTPRRLYCKFMLLMGHARSGPLLEEWQKTSKGTKLRTQAFKHYMKRQRVDLFNYLLGRDQRREALEEEMVEMGVSPSDMKRMREDLAKRESAFLRLKRSRIKIKDFQLLALIGRGGYGEVYLCRKIDTREILVLKRMKKALYLTKNEVPRVQRERAVLSGSQSPWIIKLKYSFQDSEYLYLVMEYAAGGDLKTLLENLGHLEGDMAKFYFTEMLLCVEYLHGLGFVHRDLKPGNFVIDKTGHLKLIDFGLSKDGINSRFKDNFQTWNTMQSSINITLDKMNPKSNGQQVNRKKRWGLAFSLVGSPEYMAPEVLLGEGYNELVDVWGLGCCLYEMFTGCTPFYADTADMVFHNVLNWQDCMIRPDVGELSNDAWDLITRMLCDLEKRITIEEIKKHPYLQDMNLKNIRSVPAPFMPSLEDEIDTSYFNAVAAEDAFGDLHDEAMDANFTSLLESDPHAKMYFAGFTFKRFESQ